MIVYIKNDILSLADGSKVLNENKEPILEVKGKVFSPTRKKRIYDLDGNLLYTVRNKWWKLFVRKALIYDADKNKVATVKDKLFNFKDEYFIAGHQDEIEIQGNFFSATSEILRNGQVMAKLRREVQLIENAFSLEAEEADVPLLVAIVIAIDNIKDRKRGRH